MADKWACEPDPTSPRAAFVHAPVSRHARLKAASTPSLHRAEAAEEAATALPRDTYAADIIAAAVALTEHHRRRIARPAVPPARDRWRTRLLRLVFPALMALWAAVEVVVWLAGGR